ncbi:MAG: cell division protein FtsA, partial [Candidatus Methylomirabilis sp.]|nr:cell division protein FtsA [Deltaproteobacteria bacterium]
MARKQEEYIVGLDIGTTKIAAIVGQRTEEGIKIIGKGTAESRGLRRGVVINIEATVKSIREAVEEAELMAGIEIHHVYAGIAGSHIKAFNSHGVVGIKGGEVSPADVARVIDAAKAVAIPLDREVIHVLPQEFVVDGETGIKDPIRMSGTRLEAWVHIVTGAVTSADNIVKCAKQTGLNVNDIALEPLASAQAVLTEDEKELGVAMIDIGGGTTDLAVFHDGSIKHTAVFALGGNHLTNDIAVGLKTPYNEAERIKRKHGACLGSLVSPHEEIEVPSVGDRKPRELSRQVLAEIIECRAQEMFEIVNDELVKSGYREQIVSGVVITGG